MYSFLISTVSALFGITIYEKPISKLQFFLFYFKIYVAVLKMPVQYTFESEANTLYLFQNYKFISRYSFRRFLVSLVLQFTKCVFPSVYQCIHFYLNF